MKHLGTWYSVLNANVRKFITVSVTVFCLLGTFLVVQASGTMQFSSYTPANGSTVSVFNPNISVYVRDSTYNLNASSLKVTLNGTHVPAKFTFKGHWVYDTCLGNQWVVDSYQEGTISYQAMLPSGTYDVRAEITNSAGIMEYTTWSFTVAGEIVFKNMTPTTTLGIRNPVISSRAYAPEGTFSLADVKMSVGNNIVTPTLAYQTDHYLISYQPKEALMDGTYPVYLEVYNSGKSAYDSVNWSFSVDADITYSNHAPGIGSIIGTSNPGVSVYVEAGVNKLASESVTATLNGQTVTPTFQYKGYWVHDTCGSTYVVTSYSVGTISFDTSGLVDGTYTVEVSIANNLGIRQTETWQFTVSTEIKFSNYTPDSGSVASVSQPKISVTAYDGNKDISDSNNFKMFINGYEVTPTVSEVGGTALEISYVPEEKLSDGTKTVRVNVFDTVQGEYKTTSWSFSVDARPRPSDWAPAKGSIISTASPVISVLVTDTFNNINGTSLTAKLNGQSVSATYHVTEIHDSCGFIGYNYKQGTITLNTAGLQDGVNIFEYSIADAAGNVLTESWSFTVSEAPKISSLNPANGSEIGGTVNVSAVIKDNTAVDWNSVNLYINDSLVTHTADPVTGTVTANDGVTDNSFKVLLEASDTSGNQRMATWNFLAVTSPPTLSELKFFSDNMTITSGVLKFYARLNQVVDINDNATLKLNGEPLAIDFKYKGYADSCTDTYIVTSKKEAYVAYEKYVPDGKYHKLELYVEDKFGNGRTWTWTFDALAPPTVSSVGPVKYGMTELQPVIAATVKDNDTLASVVLTINGDVIEGYSFDAATGRLTYKPPVPLANEMNYLVNVTATDGVGLVTSRNWAFNINSYPDMIDSNVSYCTVCHGNISSSPEPYEAVHPAYLFSGHDNYCGRCHNYVNPLDVCGDCHNESSDLYQSGKFPPHGLRPDKKYSATKLSTTIPVRVTVNRENWDCVICHQPGAGPSHLGSHDIPQLHRANAENCSECHAQSLTREHARDGRKDVNGQPITCLTCHKSTRSDVQTAISTNNLDCGACHDLDTTAGGHTEMHEVSLGTQCVNCHGTSMMSETVYHQNDCKVCHSSTVTKYQKAIELQNRTCFGCHEEPHGVKMSVIRGDVPLYTGVTWSKPDPATVWSGEGWLPDELNNEMALVLFSNKVNLSGDTIYSFYQTALIANGWVQVTETAEESGAFSMLYRKGRRHILVWYFSGMTPTSGGGTGYRIVTVYN